MGEEEGEGHNGHHTPAQGQDGGLSAPARGAVKAGFDNVGPGKEEAQKVQAQAGDGVVGQLGGVLAVEHRHQGPGKGHYHRHHHRGHTQADEHGVAVDAALALGVAGAVAGTGQRLEPLGDAVEEGDPHQGDIGHDAVGGHRRIARQMQENEVKDHGGHAAGHLPHKGHHPQLTGGEQAAQRGQGGGEADGVAGGEVVEQADGHAHHRGEAGGQGGPGHAQPQGEHEQIVKEDVEQAAEQGGGHGDAGGAIVAHKGGTGEVEHEQGCKTQHNADVIVAHPADGVVRPHQPQHSVGHGHTQRHKHRTHQQGPGDGVGEVEVVIGGVAPLAQGIAGGGADADHGAQGEDEPIEGQHQVQRGDAVGALGQGDKKGVGQDVAGGADHGQNVGE